MLFDYFGGVSFTFQLTLHNKTGGCRGLPLVSYRFATRGSTEASSSPLGAVARGLFNAAGTGATYLATLEVTLTFLYTFITQGYVTRPTIIAHFQK